MSAAANSSSSSSSVVFRRGLSTYDDAEASAQQQPDQDRGHEKCVNSVTLLGRVGIDPQLRGSEEHPVVIFSLATNLRYRPGGDGDYATKTDWHNVAVFR